MVLLSWKEPVQEITNKTWTETNKAVLCSAARHPGEPRRALVTEARAPVSWLSTPQ